MKKISIAVENSRVRTGAYGSNGSYGNNGQFLMFAPTGEPIMILVSDQCGWDHVSVSCRNRPPTWDEMCFVKDLFFDADETVIQYHPPKSKYVDNCGNCLHLWRNHKQEVELPPRWMV